MASTPWQIQSAGSPPVNQSLSEARQLAQAEVKVRAEIRDNLKREALEQVRQLAYQNVTGQLPPDVIQRRQARAVSAVNQVANAAPSVANQVLQFNSPTGNNEMAQVGRAGALLQSTVGQLAGPLGAAANVAGAFGQAVALVGDAFKQYLPTLAEANQLLRERAGLHTQARQLGMPTAENLHAAFQGTGALGALQDPGLNTAQRVDFLRQMHTASRQQVRQLEGRNLGEGRAALEDLMTEIRDRGRAGLGQGNRYQRMTALLDQYQIRQQDRPQQLENFRRGALGNVEARSMTDPEIRALAETTMTGQLRQAQAQAEVSGAILRGGQLPNLRPGAPQLADLPNLFQSRQGDVLEIHAQVQQEVVRDQRQQAQFEAQMRLWTNIQRDIRALSFPAVVD